jgi:hypothetical protein
MMDELLHIPQDSESIQVINLEPSDPASSSNGWIVLIIFLGLAEHNFNNAC